MINKKDVLSIHKVLIEKFGGSPGVRDENALDAAINRPYGTFDGKEFYPSPEEKSAAIIESLLINHPFIDGNKRMTEQAAVDNNRGVAIVINNQVNSVPRVMSPITSGHCSVTGDFSKKEAQKLAQSISIGRLAFQLTLKETEVLATDKN